MRTGSERANVRGITHRVVVQWLGRKALWSDRDGHGKWFAEYRNGRFMSPGSRSECSRQICGEGMWSLEDRIRRQ
jgi:hypothetical protein